MEDSQNLQKKIPKGDQMFVCDYHGTIFEYSLNREKDLYRFTNI